MKKLEIVGFKRETLGTKSAKDLRNEALVPCVLYGGETCVNFYAPMILFRELLYSPNVYEVQLNVEGTVYRAVLQDSQFHPVNDMLLHVDFLEVDDAKKIKLNVPVKFVGSSKGVLIGGKLSVKLRSLTLKGTVNDIPDFVEVDITHLDLGKSVKVGEVKLEGVTILNSVSNPIATVDIPHVHCVEKLVNIFSFTKSLGCKSKAFCF
jgi:large subunit ribosomal protein L25